MTSGAERQDLRGVVTCPWHCGAPVRRTVNARSKIVFVDLEPDPRGRIAAWWDGDRWRSRQLHKGEGLTHLERRWMIHLATCWRVARTNGRPARPPRPVVVPPPPGPIPAALAEETHQQLETIRQRRRQRGKEAP